MDSYRRIGSDTLFGSRGVQIVPLSKGAVKRRSLATDFYKPLSQSATVVLQNCEDEVMNRYPIFNLPSHFTTVSKVKILIYYGVANHDGIKVIPNTHPETRYVLSMQPPS